MNSLLLDLDPAVEPLLELVFKRVDASMLQEIAEADYGRDVNAHLQDLLLTDAIDRTSEKNIFNISYPQTLVNFRLC